MLRHRHFFVLHILHHAYAVAVLSGDGKYDAVIPHSSKDSYAGIITSGYVQNLKYVNSNFSSGKALFSMLGIGSYYGVMRDLEPDFGLLPLPKYDEQQQSYYTLRADGYIAIPAVVNDMGRRIPCRCSRLSPSCRGLSVRRTHPADIPIFHQ